MSNTYTVVKELQTGYQIDKYILEERLGRGGGGEVWLAHHQNKNLATIKYAIKFLINPGPREQNRFEQEMKILAHLARNPHIIKASDCGEFSATIQEKNSVTKKVIDERKWQKLPFLVMEYAENGDLSSRISKNLSTYEIAGYLEQIAAGLDYAHKEGYIHRDLKPSNLLLDSQYTIKIADFGIAHDENYELTPSNIKLGTPEYMAPEQFFDAKRVGKATDIYSLGVIAFQLLTGKLPFGSRNEGRSYGELENARTKATIPQLKLYKLGLPSGLQTVIDKVLAKEPRNRYQTAGAFATAFRKALVPDKFPPLPDRTEPITPSEQYQVVLPTRRRILSGWLGVTVVSLLIVAGIMTMQALNSNAGNATPTPTSKATTFPVTQTLIDSATPTLLTKATAMLSVTSAITTLPITTVAAPTIAPEPTSTAIPPKLPTPVPIIVLTIAPTSKATTASIPVGLPTPTPGYGGTPPTPTPGYGGAPPTPTPG
ncbi:MAG: serine/threonine protein kinase [Chloroflexi bacterium]|uniref:Protein kinase n=1 Tax=Candidatus Chlorohelix allophototropha TaxID=3003348 RepID=A0A8T7MAY7_9CHLR|nr:serine/threonine protein kinase [Chloroflexota bacterium]WJW70112.1 protein kinase [Chloroflexota bacterium L227-S17]